ncbi:hypothetical protein [Streptomyces sp. NPDC020681]|uniref:hypothetical protein n=1 Tax=Streptomyces sp. NPDC020681 TaxID=3365083 RepID=UPI0037A8E9D3
MLIPLLAVGGSESFRAALDFAAGVLSLVSLTASVAWGLIATDRLLLTTRQRLISQAIHRTTATASLGFLVLHATVKVTLGHVEVVGALIPFGLGVSGTAGLIGFGSLAGYLMIIAATTGALRSALAGNIKVAGRWRPLHMLAYPAWCFALVHGLYAGRPAATWVTTMYCLALAAVTGAVSLRLLPRPMKRRIANKILSLTGGDPDGPLDEDLVRDQTGPLPGMNSLTGPAGLNRMNGIPSQRSYEYEQDLQRTSPLGQPSSLGPSRQQPRLAAPAPQLYEAPPPPQAEPNIGSVPGNSAGTGISAAYRAVSLGSDPNAPLAERIPMTEEIPVISETGPAPGMWPTPSPRPPAQAVPSEPAAPAAYEPPAPPVYEPPIAYNPAETYAPEASAGTSFSSFETPLYDPLYEAPSTPPYETPPSPYETGTAGVYDDTAPMPGPLYPPPAGEPWNAPAGERP